MAEAKSKDKETNKESQSSKKFAEDWLPVVDIRNGMIEVDANGLLAGGRQFVTGVRVEPKNIFIADTDTQNRTIIGLRNFYNTLDYEFWLITCDRPVDIGLYKAELEIMYQNAVNQQIRKLILQDINKCDMFTGPAYNAVDTEFYIIFKEDAKNLDLIHKRLHNLITNLAQAGLSSRQLTDDDCRVLLDSFFNDGKRTEFGTVMTDV